MDGQTAYRQLEMTLDAKHIATVKREIDWFQDLLHDQFQSYFNKVDFEPPTAPDISTDESAYAALVRQYDLQDADRIVLVLALIPHLKPELLDIYFTKNADYDRGFTEFGGYLGKFHGGFLPTMETALFILSSGNVAARAGLLSKFTNANPLFGEDILSFESTDQGEPMMSRPLTISERYLDYLITGNLTIEYSFGSFPAHKIQTDLSWDDLVVDREVREDIEQIKSWIKYGKSLMTHHGLSGKVKPGYRSLFYGPPGTGKTLTATLLGKSTGKEVYRVDLSSIVSKYIGETEKNLRKVFDIAEKHDWILFFDEADALFGKRTQTNSSNDRFANQEVSYLLQRVEDYDGVIILASNLRSNMDEAFTRRFQSLVYFGIPNAKQRRTIWEKIFSGSLPPQQSLDLEQLARDYELSGGAAINVYRYGALCAMQRGIEEILEADILKGIQKEYQKEGKTIKQKY